MEQEELRLRKGGAVTVPVAGSAAAYVDTFRRRYDPHVDLIMPHITLAFAAELDACDWMPVRSRIQAALADIAAVRRPGAARRRLSRQPRSVAPAR